MIIKGTLRLFERFECTHKYDANSVKQCIIMEIERSRHRDAQRRYDWIVPWEICFRLFRPSHGPGKWKIKAWGNGPLHA